MARLAAPEAGRPPAGIDRWKRVWKEPGVAYRIANRFYYVRRLEYDPAKQKVAITAWGRLKPLLKRKRVHPDVKVTKLETEHVALEAGRPITIANPIIDIPCVLVQRMEVGRTDWIFACGSSAMRYESLAELTARELGR